MEKSFYLTESYKTDKSYIIKCQLSENAFTLNCENIVRAVATLIKLRRRFESAKPLYISKGPDLIPEFRTKFKRNFLAHTFPIFVL